MRTLSRLIFAAAAVAGAVYVIRRYNLVEKAIDLASDVALMAAGNQDELDDYTPPATAAAAEPPPTMDQYGAFQARTAPFAGVSTQS